MKVRKTTAMRALEEIERREPLSTHILVTIIYDTHYCRARSERLNAEQKSPIVIDKRRNKDKLPD